MFDEFKAYFTIQAGFFWSELKTQAREGWSFFLLNWIGFAIFAIIIGLVALAIWPSDKAILSAVQYHEETAIHRTAHEVSYWGDFLTGSVIFFIVVWIIGAICKKPTCDNIRRIAVACLLSAVIAGATVNCFRLTLGRPRPSAKMEDGFYGLQRDAKYHGFPSGHAATSIGTSAPLMVICPPVGVPFFIISTSVGWSRMQLNRHHLTDIIVGSSFGVVAGFAIGIPVRRRNRALPKAEDSEDSKSA